MDPSLQSSSTILSTLKTAIQQIERLIDEAVLIEAHVSKLYLNSPRDGSPLDQMIIQARNRCIYTTQSADEARRYLAFMLGELDPQPYPEHLRLLGQYAKEAIYDLLFPQVGDLREAGSCERPDNLESLVREAMKDNRFDGGVRARWKTLWERILQIRPWWEKGYETFSVRLEEQRSQQMNILPLLLADSITAQNDGVQASEEYSDFPDTQLWHMAGWMAAWNEEFSS